MNIFVRRLFYLAMAMALIASLGLSASPAQAAGPKCDPAFVKQQGSVFTVLPNGVDDTANLACAFESAKAAGAGSTAQLVKGEYHVGLIQVADFDGAFRGAGTGKTVLHPLHHMDCQALVDQNMSAAWLTFRLGNPRISDMTLYDDDPEPCATYSGDVWGAVGNDFFALNLTGKPLGKVYDCAQLKIPQFGRGTVTRIEVKTPPMSEVDTTKYISMGISTGGEVGNNPDCAFWPSLVGGDYTISDSTYSLPGASFVISPAILGGTTRILNNVVNGGLFGIYSIDANGTQDIISGNTVSGTKADAIRVDGGTAWVNWTNMPPFDKPTYFAITNNTVSATGQANGITAWDVSSVVLGQHHDQGMISGNTITLDGDSTWGIWVEGVNGAVVNHNAVKGKGNAGILMNLTGYTFGSGDNAWTFTSSATMKDCWVTLNDLSGLAGYDANYIAGVFLGPQTNHCTVIGSNLSDTVLDAGTGNILVNLTRWSGQFNLPAVLHDKLLKARQFRWGH